MSSIPSRGGHHSHAQLAHSLTNNQETFTLTGLGLKLCVRNGRLQPLAHNDGLIQVFNKQTHHISCACRNAPRRSYGLKLCDHNGRLQPLAHNDGLTQVFDKQTPFVHILKCTTQVMGSNFVNQDAFNPKHVMEESSSSTPIFFILFPGYSPSKEVEQHANKVSI